VLNKRGVTWRGLTDGGTKERELATFYQLQADNSSEWPRTRRLLTRLQQSYVRDAQQEEDEAEAVRRGL
jgi:hypothetical protein